MEELTLLLDLSIQDKLYFLGWLVKLLGSRLTLEDWRAIKEARAMYGVVAKAA